jgi:hypothetical protein
MADETLKAFLNEGTSAAEATTQETAPAAKTDEAPAADQTPVVTGAPPAPVQQTKDQDDKGEVGPIPYDRFKKELDKRHELEREAAELRGRLSVHERTQTQQQTPPKPEAPKLTDEERFFTDGAGLIRETREGITNQITVLKREFQFGLAEQAVRQKHADYDAKKQVFEKQLAAEKQAYEAGQITVPTLYLRFGNAPDPAAFIYQEGAMIEEMHGVESPQQYREKVSKQLETEIEARIRKELALESAANVSTTNAGARSTGGNAAPVAPRMTPDKEIFRGVMRK